MAPKWNRKKKKKRGRYTDRVKGALADVEQKLFSQKVGEKGGLIGLKLFGGLEVVPFQGRSTTDRIRQGAPRG